MTPNDGTRRTICLVAAAVLCMAGICACGETAEDSGGRITVQLQAVSLLPEDWSGFRTGSAGGQTDHGQDGICYSDLSEAEAKAWLECAEPLSIGPNGLILWLTKDPSNYDRIMVVQRGKTIVPLRQAKERSAEDKDGILKQELRYKAYAEPEYINGEVRWSEDGKYMFLNESGKWFESRMMADNPYLTDTETGEIFLVETDGKQKDLTANDVSCIRGGRFSRDTEFFVYCMSEKKNGRQEYVLKKYHLSTGTIEELFRTDSLIHDFCEFGDDRWILATGTGNGKELIRLTKNDTGYSAESEALNTPGGNLKLIPVSGELALLQDVNYFYSCFVPIRKDEPADTSFWYSVGDLSEGTLTSRSAEEASEAAVRIMQELRTQNEAMPEYSAVQAVARIDGNDRLLMKVQLGRNVPDSWKGMREKMDVLIALDPENLQAVPVWTGTEIPVFHDAVLYTDNLILGSRSRYQAYSFTEDDTAARVWYVLSQPEESITRGNIYTCSCGTYKCAGSTSMLSILPYGILTEDTEIGGMISTEGEGYRLHLSFAPVMKDGRPEFLLPLAVSVERFREITDRMEKKDQKKTRNFYKLWTQKEIEKSGRADELYERYPKLKTEEMYILRDELHDHQLEMLETIMASAGYTEEDFELDRENISGPLQEVKTFPVNYAYSNDLRDSITRSDALRLAGLCDRICSTVYMNWYVEGGQLDAPLEDLLSETYIIDGISYAITIESIEYMEDTLVIIFHADAGE